MKKSIFLVAATAVAMVSCGGGAPKADLQNDVDSVSYAIGMAQTQGLKEYLVGNLQVDTAYMDEFIKGLNEAANAGADKKKAAYFAGLQIGQQIANQMIPGINHELFGNDTVKTVSLKNFLSGFITATEGKGGIMSIQDAQMYAQTQVPLIKRRSMEAQYGANKVAGEKFLAANAKKPGVVTLPSGVQYKVIKEGKGAIPTDTSFVQVHYQGTLINGTEFDSSYKRGEAQTLRADRVIKGWTEVLTKMPVGSVWEVYIPQELAYGDRETGEIKPFSTLIFKIELVGIGEGKK